MSVCYRPPGNETLLSWKTSRATADLTDSTQTPGQAPGTGSDLGIGYAILPSPWDWHQLPTSARQSLKSLL